MAWLCRVGLGMAWRGSAGLVRAGLGSVGRGKVSTPGGIYEQDEGERERETPGNSRDQH
jgi:hypothetical protein